MSEGMPKIGPDDLRRKFAELYSQSERPKNELMADFYGYIAERASQLTPEAEMLVDKLGNVLKSEFKEALRKAPETPEIHELRRMFAKVTGAHWDAVSLIRSLESKTTLDYPIVAAARPLFEKHFQSYLDLLWDVVQHRHRGVAAAVRTSMFCLSADELLAAFHLAQRGYASQAYTHLRIAMEAMNLIELFTRSPELADEWVGDAKAAWKKFSPAKVRRALAQGPQDQFYSFLSEYGVHVTWRTIQIRTAMVRPAKSGGLPQVLLNIGGTPFVQNIVHSNILCFYLLSSLIVKLPISFGESMEPIGGERIVRESASEIMQFVLEHYIPWARQEGLNVDEMETFIKGQISSLRGGSP